jgi:NADH dehydrogenase
MNAVTGAFGYTGKYITRRLIEAGETVITLTGNPGRANEFGAAVKAFPFDFDHFETMARSLSGVRVLYNTYWVRFNKGDTTHERAVENTIALIRAAQMAGVERIVHISIANPTARPDLPYFRGKAQLEEVIRGTKMGHAIIRPTVIFGAEDILINNIAFLLRKLPAFLVPGNGQYRIQPVYVEDVARIAVEMGGRTDNATLDAVGPETFRYEDLVRLIAKAVGSRALIMHGPPWMALLGARAMGLLLHDVMLTRDELDGLMGNLLVSDGIPTGTTKLSEWIAANAETLGKRYAQEIGRHYRR